MHRSPIGSFIANYKGKILQENENPYRNGITALKIKVEGEVMAQDPLGGWVILSINCVCGCLSIYLVTGVTKELLIGVKGSLR